MEEEGIYLYLFWELLSFLEHWSYTLDTPMLMAKNLISDTMWHPIQIKCAFKLLFSRLIYLTKIQLIEFYYTDMSKKSQNKYLCCFWCWFYRKNNKPIW